MPDESVHLQDLSDIRKLMEKSSRFISLSGLSGIAAGVCALIAAYVAYGFIADYQSGLAPVEYGGNAYVFHPGYEALAKKLLILAAVTFASAAALAFIFTYLRSKKTGVPIWGHVARKVMLNVMVPMTAGGILILRIGALNIYGLIAPLCLIFYGLALINAGKYTFSEIRYLGYSELVLGLISLWLPGYGLLFWAFGFGVLHIIYGTLMWMKYERRKEGS